MKNDNSMNWYKTSQSEKKLIVVRGIAGSGKSTLAKSFGDNVYSADDFFMKDGEYQFDPSLIRQAHIWNHKRVKDAMEQNASPIVVDNTHVKFWEMKEVVKMAVANGYQVEFKEPNWHPDLHTPEGKWNFDFLKGRNTHNVPDSTISKKIKQYQYNPNVEEVLKSKAPWEK